MAFGATEIHQPALGQQVDAAVARQIKAVHLRFDIEARNPFGLVEAVHLNLIIEVANVANDGLIFHPEHVFQGDDVAIASASDINVGLTERLFQGRHFKAFHRRLQGVDGIDFGDNHSRAKAAQALGAAFADVAITANEGSLASNHDAQRALEAVGQGFAAAIQVVEFGLGDGVIDVDGRHQKFARLKHLVKAMHPGRGFFADAFPILDCLGEPPWAFFGATLQELFDDLFFVAAARRIGPIAALLHFVALMQ